MVCKYRYQSIKTDGKPLVPSAWAVQVGVAAARRLGARAAWPGARLAVRVAMVWNGDRDSWIGASPLPTHGRRAVLFQLVVRLPTPQIGLAA